MVDEEEPKKPKPVKLVDVRPVAKAGKSILVEYTVRDATNRVYVPLEVVKEGKAPLDDLQAGVQYGIAWETLKVNPITSAALAQALRNAGIYTMQDLNQNKVPALVVIGRLAGLAPQDIAGQLNRKEASNE